MRVPRPQAEFFRYASLGIVSAKPGASAPATPLRRAYMRVRHVVVVVPEFVALHWWERVLHNRTAARLRRTLIGRPNTVVALVPYGKEH